MTKEYKLKLDYVPQKGENRERYIIRNDQPDISNITFFHMDLVKPTIERLNPTHISISDSAQDKLGPSLTRDLLDLVKKN